MKQNATLWLWYQKQDALHAFKVWEHFGQITLKPLEHLASILPPAWRNPERHDSHAKWTLVTNRQGGKSRTWGHKYNSAECVCESLSCNISW